MGDNIAAVIINAVCSKTTENVCGDTSGTPTSTHSGPLETRWSPVMVSAVWRACDDATEPTRRRRSMVAESDRSSTR